MSELALDTKASLLSGVSMWHLEAVAELGLASIMVTDGPHGLRKQTEEGGISGTLATCFPTAAGLAATWDPALVHEVGVAIARECLAEDVAVLLGPGANIKRHPLCGRNFEYLSEDPLVSGRLSAAFINGVQSQGVGTSIKHFVANNQEANRMVLDTLVDDRTLREIYLAGFEIAVHDAQPWAVMCAYNRINGTYCSDNDWLLTTVLRDEWGFDGLVMTDWGAVHDRVQGVRAGLDLEMPGSGGFNDMRVAEAVRSGVLDEDTVDVAAGRALSLIERGNSTLAGDAGTRAVDFDAHHELARRAAASSHVLLTNDGLLPLRPSQSVALIGAFAAEPRYQGSGSSLVNPTRVDCLVEAMAAAGLSVNYSSGYDPAAPDGRREDLLAEAVLAAGQAEVAVVCIGLPESYEVEGIDRQHMRMPDQHNRLVEAVVEANPNTVVVLSNGSAVELPWINKPRAIVESFLAGQGGGVGTARVLLGEVNPAGKLAETFPLRQADHGADVDFGPGKRQVQYREGVFVGYRWFDALGLDVRFPFGHGLSYTTFDFSELEIAGSTNADDDRFGIDVSVTVTNTGARSGAEVVQLYVRDVSASVERPDRELKDFARVELEAGASDTVTFKLDRRAFAFWGGDGWHVEPGDFDILVGASSRDVRQSATVTVDSEIKAAGPAAPSPSFDRLADDAVFEKLLGRAIPPVEPVRPFTVDSTLAEVSSSRVGALLRKATLAMGMKQVGVKEAELDDSMRRVLEAIIDGLPLRNLTLLSEGKVSARALDRLVRILNLNPLNRLPGRGGERLES